MDNLGHTESPARENRLADPLGQLTALPRPLAGGERLPAPTKNPHPLSRPFWLYHFPGSGNTCDSHMTTPSNPYSHTQRDSVVFSDFRPLCKVFLTAPGADPEFLVTDTGQI